MIHRNLKSCLDDLERSGQLVRIDTPVDPYLEIGAIQRRVFQAEGPALLFTNVRGTRFPMAANIFGTLKRTKYIFRSTLRRVEAMLAAKADPAGVVKKPGAWPGLALGGWHTLPKTVAHGPILHGRTTISQLPQLVSWPMDGGSYVTLPLVYTESPSKPGYMGSNLGMYRIQLSGNEFEQDREVGLHYQIHRGIGYHHAEAIARDQVLPVNVFVGGPPAMTLAAIMPLPEGIAEILFAGALGGHRVPMIRRPGQLPILAEADFCIRGRIDPRKQKPEGPFGDHLGYYSLVHDFPVMEVEEVLYREGAIWPFTTVGRPPQEDTMFGAFIHELTADLVPQVFGGVHAVHAVDAAGVHPLLLAVGSERYVPYAGERQPQELITNGLSLLGNTQTSLSKYVILAAREDEPGLSCHHAPEFFRHVLERLDLSRDLHFVTRTTMDTLDYSGISLNQGSKVLWTAAGSPKRVLATAKPQHIALPDGFSDPCYFAPGILVISGPAHGQDRDTQDPAMEGLCRTLEKVAGLEGFPLIVVADDARFTAANWDNFLWVTFTRSDPATDTYGLNGFIHCKHWGCRAMVIDARLKTYHAPPLVNVPEIEKKVDTLALPGGPLYGIL
jgi:4-hydroxy-3-polyprenylbenzoate decarboxylase